LFAGPTLSGYSWGCQVPRAPLHDRGVTSLIVVPRTTSAGVTLRHRSYGLMRQSSTLPLPTDYPWSTGLCRLLSAPAGRRTFPTLLCTSFPACLDPYPGSSWSASTRYFLHDIGLPRVRTGSALSNIRTATSVRRVFRGCSHSLMFRPAGLLTTPVAPTATDRSVWQPWFLRPSLSWFVTSPRPGYACRPNRVIDGRGLSPHKMRSLVGCSPNATLQAPPIAGAT